MKKRMFSILLTLCMLFSLLPLSAAAAEIVDSGACGEGVTYTLDSDGVLTIRGTGEISGSYFEDPEGDRPPIRNVVIEDGVTAIGSGVFYYNVVKSVTIPESVTAIGLGAFRYEGDFDVWYAGTVEMWQELRAESLSGANLHASDFEGRCGVCGSHVGWTLDTEGNLVVSGTGPMYDHDPDQYVGPDYTFEWEHPIYTARTVTIEPGVTSIGAMFLQQNRDLRSVSIPDTVTSIGYSAFQDCPRLEELTLPDTVAKIGAAAFKGCSSLPALTIPNGVQKIAQYTFSGCTSLESVTIPEQVTTIGRGAFADCAGVTSVTIPKGVQLIDEYAFNGCANLTDVYFGGTRQEWNVLAIGGYNNPLVNAEKHYGESAADETPAPGPEPTESPEPSVSPKPTASPEPTASPKPTAKPEPTASPKPTAKPEPTAKPTPTPAVKNPFQDVPKKEYYYAPVLWAVNHDPQITNGADATHFVPNAACTRAQIVTFLWRAKGCPDPKTAKNPFKDVTKDDYYYKAVLWAVEKGVTNGTSKTTFSPTATVTRAQTVTFLWRAEGEPKTTAKNPFKDVPSGQYFTKAVLWAVSKDITNGTDKTHFSPNAACTRGQIVTFLYRDLAKK